MLYSTVDQLEP